MSAIGKWLRSRKERRGMTPEQRAAAKLERAQRKARSDELRLEYTRQTGGPGGGGDGGGIGGGV